MPSIPSDLPPIIERTPTAEVEAWQNLRSFFDKKMAILREMRDKYGIETADADQVIMLKEFPRSEYEMWENMFMRGCLQNPSATDAIMETRKSFSALTEPLLSKEQEYENKRMDELKQLLEKVLEKINELESCGSEMAASKKLSVDLMKQIESYFDLAQSSDEAKNLIQEIVVNIGKLAKLTNKRQNG